MKTSTDTGAAPDPQEATPRTPRSKISICREISNVGTGEECRDALRMSLDMLDIAEREAAALHRRVKELEEGLSQALTASNVLIKEIDAEVEARRVAEERAAELLYERDTARAKEYVAKSELKRLKEVHEYAKKAVTAEQQRAEQAEAKAREVSEKYHDLVMQVGNKYPDESRHDTAKRYIINAESQTSNASQAAITERGEG